MKMKAQLVVLLAVCGYAAAVGLTDEVVQQYTKAFEEYQVKFEKHYGTAEEYNLRLHAYAVWEKMHRHNGTTKDLGALKLCL